MSMNSTVDCPVYPHSSIHCHLSTLSWRSIIAGTIVALSVAMLFNLLGMGLGFSVFSPDANTISNIGMGSLIWLALTGMLSTFAGGWVAGKSTQFGLNFHGALHGLLTWAVATLFICLLTTSAASAIITTGAVSVMNKDMKIAAQVMDQSKAQLQNPQTQQKIEEASKALGSIAFSAFVMFLLSAIAGAFGGYLGGGCANDDEYRREVNSSAINPNLQKI